MSIYECTMVDNEREHTPDVRCTNVEMVGSDMNSYDSVYLMTVMW